MVAKYLDWLIVFVLAAMLAMALARKGQWHNPPTWTL